MAQAANIVINDGQATPVATTFTPVKVSPDLSVFADRSAGVSLAFRTLKVSTSAATAQRPTDRATYWVDVPITSTVNGVTTLVGTLRAKLDIVMPNVATAAQRNDLYAFLSNGLANTLVKGALRDLDPLY